MSSSSSCWKSERELSLGGRHASLLPVLGHPGVISPQRRGGFSSSLKRSTTPFVPAPSRERARRRRCRPPPVTRQGPSKGGPNLRHDSRRALQPWQLQRSEAGLPPTGAVEHHRPDTRPPLPKGVLLPRRRSCLPPRSKHTSWKKPKDGLLSYAQSVWGLYSKQFWNMKVPEWYPGLFGIPGRLLRQPSGSLSLKERGLCLIARMNYILDHPHRFGVEPHHRFFCLPARRLALLCRTTGPLYDYESGSYQLITAGMHVHFDTAYACQFKYNWHRALACSLRNFVHLAVGFTALQPPCQRVPTALRA